MKWKSKETEDMYHVNNGFFITIKRIVPDWQKYFNPVYEIGESIVIDWVEHSGWGLVEGKPYKVNYYNSANNAIGFEGVLGAFVPNEMIKLHLATPEEIESATKKFPFEYLLGAKHTVRECPIYQQDQIVIENDLNQIWLSKEAFLEIGKRKGWL